MELRFADQARTTLFAGLPVVALLRAVERGARHVEPTEFGEVLRVLGEVVPVNHGVQLDAIASRDLAVARILFLLLHLGFLLDSLQASLSDPWPTVRLATTFEVGLAVQTGGDRHILFVRVIAGLIER